MARLYRRADFFINTIFSRRGAEHAEKDMFFIVKEGEYDDQRYIESYYKFGY